MKIAAALFVLSEISAFTLWYFQVLPTFGVCLFLLGGLAAGLVLGNLDNPGKPLQGIEKPRRMIPSGYGSDVPISDNCEMNQWALQVREITGGRQRNDALIRLMQAIDTEINARLEKQGLSGKSDNGYDLPSASYPMEMEMYDR
jgi:hypothetical protein